MANIALIYKKFLEAPHVDVLVYSSSGSPVDTIGYRNAPPWLKLITQAQERNPSGKITSYTYRVAVDPDQGNLLAPGNHTAEVEILAYSGSNFEPAVVNRLNVNLEVIDTIALSLSKTTFNFSYVLGSAAPSTQPLTINTENAWSIVGNQPWLTFSASNGNSTQTIDLGVNVAGLAIGLYEATFQVDDGGSVKQGTVSLLISGSDESGDFLIISRSSLSFSEVYQELPTRSAAVTVETSLEAAVSTVTPWLNISAVNFPAGTHQLLVSTKETEGLSLGNYTGSVKIQTGFSTKTIAVLLRIVQEQTEGIVSGQLYFADDRNMLILGTGMENAEAYMEFSASASGRTIAYTRRRPYFSSIAQVIIGLETAVFLKPENLPAVLNTGAFSPVKPLVMDFTVFDKTINSTAISERQSYAAVRFLNGRTPAVPNKLSNIPSTITTTAKGLVSFSFYSPGGPVNNISITGAVTSNIPISPISTNIYAVVVDLATLNLVPGNKITIACGPVAVAVTIKPEELSTYRLIWLNSWQCPEVMSLDGTIEIIEEDESKRVSVAEAGREISRIIEVKEPTSFKVGTGNIYTEAEIKWLSGIIRSKNMWLEIDGNRVEVIRTFRSLTISKTRNHNRNYNLTFDAAVK